MSATGVDIPIRTSGGRRAANDLERVSKGIDKTGRNARQASKQMHGLSRASKGAGSALRGMGRSAAYGTAIVVGGLVVGLKHSVKAWEEKRKIVQQTGAVLKSTGGAANVTAEQVDSLSNSLSKTAGIDDEAIRDTQNLLLTFRGVRNMGAGKQVFTEATKAAVDLGAAMHKGPRSGALQLGKALNDPERGYKRLQRIGVGFTKHQGELIEGYVESGQKIKAQQEILKELNAEFGGSAKAQRTALGALGVSWENVEEAIGRGVAPAVDVLAEKFNTMFEDLEPRLDAFGGRVEKLMKRKDINAEMKLNLIGKDLERTTRPFRKQLEKELGKLELGDKLAHAFELAAPRIADAAGHAAPRVAGAFAKGFMDSGPYGQAFTIAFLGSKLGVFSWAGRAASRKMGDAFKTRWGTGFRTANKDVVHDPATKTRLDKSGRVAGRRMGRSMGKAMGAAMIVAIVADAPHIIADVSAAVLGEDNPMTKEARRGWAAVIPGKEEAAGPGAGTEEARVKRWEARIAKERRAAGMTPEGRRPGERPRAARPRRREREPVIETHVQIDGREVARATNRANADSAARGARSH